MTIESNSGITWSFTFSDDVKHMTVLELQSVGLGFSHESGESGFWKMLSCLMKEQCLHEPAAVEKEPLVGESHNVTEEFFEQNIVCNVLTNLMFEDGHVAYGLKNVEHRLGEATKSQVILQEPSAVFLKEEQTEYKIAPKNGQTKLTPNDTQMAEKSTDPQDIQKAETKPEIGRTAAESLIPKDEKTQLYRSETDILNPLRSTSLASGSTEWTQANQATGKAEPHMQISEMILSKLERKGPTEFKMLLEPGTLGEIDIKLKIDKGKLIIDILAANAKTQTLLTLQADKLIASMGLRNVQVESIQINQQMPQNQDDPIQNQTMDSAIDAFLKKHQEQQRQRGFFHEGKQGGSLGQHQTEEPDNNHVNVIGARLYDSHKINYTI